MFDRLSNYLVLVIFLPVVVIFLPLIMQFPVALGLMVLPMVGAMLVMVLAVFVPTLFDKNTESVHRFVFVFVPLAVYIFAETQASFNPDRPLPDSLYYFQNEENGKAYLFTHDYKTDKWSSQFFKENTMTENDFKEFITKQWRWAKHAANTENRQVESAEISLKSKELIEDKHRYVFTIESTEDVRRINLITNTELEVYKLSVNGEKATISDNKIYTENSQLARIYSNNESYFEIVLEVGSGQSPELSIIEMRPDLISKFNLPKRPAEFMPKPFVGSDTIITKKIFKFNR